MDEILERKIEWLFKISYAQLDFGQKVYENDTISDLLNEADRIIADETVDEETTIAERTHDALKEDDVSLGNGEQYE